MSYDSVREKVVLFGGRDGGDHFVDTWEWDGADWRKVDGGTGPLCGVVSDVVYVTHAAHVLLVCGSDSDGQQVETWTWDGIKYEQQSGLNSPGSRNFVRLAYDPERELAMLFGGHGTADVWEWNGVNWGLKSVVGPDARIGHELVFDSSRGEILLIGGKTQSVGTGYQKDVWSWSGNIWNQLANTSPPYPLAWHATALHPRLKTPMLFGGEDDSTYFQTTYYLVEEWVKSPPESSPVVRDSHATAFNESMGMGLLHGGWDSNDGDPTYLEDSWVWNGSDWLEVTDYNDPGPRHGGAMAYDPGTGRNILFGGKTVPGNGPTPDDDVLDDTWAWDGTWHIGELGFPPAGRCDAGVATGGSDSLLLFGGHNISTQECFGDTWRYIVGGSSNWHLEAVAGPSARFGHSLTFEPGRSQHLLFGGYECGSVAPDLAETWVFGGEDWLELELASAPTARRNLAAAHDPMTEQTILFGGGCSNPGNNNLCGDTWAFDGQAWRELKPRTSPLARVGARMFHDSQREFLVLTGGNRTNLATEMDTWLFAPGRAIPHVLAEFDVGTTGTLRATISEPGTRELLKARVTVRGGGLSNEPVGDDSATISSPGLDIWSWVPGSGPWAKLGTSLASVDSLATWKEEFDGTWMSASPPSMGALLRDWVADDYTMRFALSSSFPQGHSSSAAELSIDYFELDITYLRHNCLETCLEGVCGEVAECDCGGCPTGTGCSENQCVEDCGLVCDSNLCGAVGNCICASCDQWHMCCDSECMGVDAGELAECGTNDSSGCGGILSGLDEATPELSDSLPEPHHLFPETDLDYFEASLTDIDVAAGLPAQPTVTIDNDTGATIDLCLFFVDELNGTPLPDCGEGQSVVHDTPDGSGYNGKPGCCLEVGHGATMTQSLLFPDGTIPLTGTLLIRVAALGQPMDCGTYSFTYHF